MKNLFKFPLHLQLFADPSNPDNSGTEPSAQGNQGLTIDYDKMAEAINKRASQTADNVVIFKLKTDVLGYENTTTLTKTTDVNHQLNNIKNEINALVQSNKNLSLTLDGVNNSINSKVEKIEKTMSDDMTQIKQSLSNVIQTSDSIEEQFKVLKEIIDENGNELQTITTYIRKTVKGIEVGELDANVKTLMGTSYFAILFNDEEKMKLEQNLLTIENIKALLGLQLGNSIFSVKNYGFDITWGGD